MNDDMIVLTQRESEKPMAEACVAANLERGQDVFFTWLLFNNKR